MISGLHKHARKRYILSACYLSSALPNFISSHQNFEVDIVTIFKNTLGLRERKPLKKGHSAKEQKTVDSNAGLPGLKPIFSALNHVFAPASNAI